MFPSRELPKKKKPLKLQNGKRSTTEKEKSQKEKKCEKESKSKFRRREKERQIKNLMKLRWNRYAKK